MPPPPPSPPAQARVLGTLIVVVLRAKNLPNRVRIGKQNPYATITYGLHKKRTSTIERGGQQPEWDEEFRFEILRDGFGAEEQQAGEAAASVNAQGGVGPPATPTKDGAAASKPRASLVAPQTTGYPPGKRVLELACWADDARDPKLIGEGELDIENTIKSGRFDDWVKLERKGRYSGEIYLELTWYSNDPRPSKPARREPSANSGGGATAYGGAGARVEDYSGSESGTEEWDGGSQVGLSGAMTSTTPAVDLGADYPDADLAPLNRSMSAMALSRPPLPQPPGGVTPSTSAYNMHRLSSSQSYQHLPYQSAPPPASPAPYGSYGYADQRRASQPYALGSYTPAPPPQHQQDPYAAGGAGEFGAYPGYGAGPPPPPTLSQHQQPLGEFEQLAHQHYANQSYQVPPAQPYSHQPPPPPPQQPYDPYSSAHYAAPPPPPSQQPAQPLPSIPPSGSAYWQHGPPPSTTPLPTSPSYPSMPHSDSQTTIYAPPQPPQPPSAASAFSPPPPPPSIAGSYSAYPQQPTYPQPPQPPAFPHPPQPPAFPQPPPPPPSLRGGLPVPPPRPASTADYGSWPQPPLPPPVPPLPLATPQYAPQATSHYTPPPSAHSATGSYPSSYPSHPSSTYAPPPAATDNYPAPGAAAYGGGGTSSPYGTVSSRPPLPQPPASAMGHRPLPGMFGAPR
ncbi:hypothetical protein JCM8097_007100 [Rhodosporidiobolus ruineniae]